MTQILPMTIEPAGSRAFGCVVTVMLSAILTSAGWYWLLTDERATQERLLTEATARHSRIQRMVIQYANGAKATIAVREAK